MEDHIHKIAEKEDGNEEEEEENEEADAKEDTKMDEEEEEEEEEDAFNREEREQTANTYNDSCFKNLFRSKGMIYVASQPAAIFTWQTAGIMNDIKHLGKWLAAGTKEELYEKGHNAEYDSWND